MSNVKWYDCSDEEKIKNRYVQECKKLSLKPDCYDLNFLKTDYCLKMEFRKNIKAINTIKIHFGKNIIITDNINKAKVREAICKLRRWIERNEGFRPYSEGFEEFEKELKL